MAGNRGPEDPSVIYLQATHMSSTVSSETIDDIIRVKRSDNLVWMLYDGNFFHNRVLAYLNHMRFYGVLQCGFRVFDNHLITALVERWRLETHTFHFRCGEATVTLQDVSIIWGLTIDGDPVTGTDVSHTVGQWQHICLDLLGFVLSASHFKGGHLSMTALHDHCISTHIDDNSSEVDVVKYTRCVALMIIGGILFPDYQGGSARLMFLQLLHDIDRVKSYSWGSAVLAFLYRELCNATRIEKSTIAGPLYILQIWAWSMIKLVNHDRDGLTAVVPPPQPNDILPVAPYAARWKNVFSYAHLPTHAVRIIRDCFDRMNNNEFNWIVYKKNNIDVNIIIDSYDNKIWRCVCPLICFEIVEIHRPNRVARQFKIRQSIPVSTLDNDELHNITRIGHRNTYWKEYHQNAIQVWNRKLRYVFQGERHGRLQQTDDDYFPWYERITIRFISPTVHEVGFRPYPYHMFAEQHNVQQNFSTPSPYSHQSSLGCGSDMVRPSSGFTNVGYGDIGPSGPFGNVGSSGQSGFWGNTGSSDPSATFGNTGPSDPFGFSGNTGPSAPSYLFDTTGPSNFLGNTAPLGIFGDIESADPLVAAQHSFADHDYQTPNWSNMQSFTDLINVGPQQPVHYMRPERNVLSPVIFLGYSDEQNVTNQEIRLLRGTRTCNPPECGTGSHLHRCNFDDDSFD